MTTAPREIDRFALRIDRDSAGRFAAAIGYRDMPGEFVPPTYPIRLLGRAPVTDHLRALAATEGGPPIHVAQSFDYGRRLRIGEELRARILSGFDGEGARRQAVLVVELRDAEGLEIGRSESRFVFARTSRQ